VHTSRKLYPPVGLQVHSDVASVSVIPLHQQLVGASRVLCIVEVLHSGIAGASHLKCKSPHINISCATDRPRYKQHLSGWRKVAEQVLTKHLAHTCCRQAQTQMQATQSAPDPDCISKGRSSSKGRQCIDWLVPSDVTQHDCARASMVTVKQSRQTLTSCVHTMTKRACDWSVTRPSCPQKAMSTE